MNRDALLVDAADAADVSLCGGKAAGLATLQRAGFERSDVLATMRARIETAKIPDDLIGRLRPALRRLTRAGDRLAVRSSAPYEDHAGASHAGIHTSAIVGADDLEALASGIKAC